MGDGVIDGRGGEKAISSTVKADDDEEREVAEQEVSTPNAIGETVRGVTQPAARRAPRIGQPEGKEVSTPNAIAGSIRDGKQKK